MSRSRHVFYGAKSTAAAVGEPFLTGGSPSQAAALATREGLVVVSDVGPAELTKGHQWPAPRS